LDEQAAMIRHDDAASLHGCRKMMLESFGGDGVRVLDTQKIENQNNASRFQSSVRTRHLPSSAACASAGNSYVGDASDF
jgi:hypothetical protein